MLDEYLNVTNYVVIDTETVADEVTRVSKMWELGIVMIIGDQIVSTKNYLMSPDVRFEKLDLWYPEDHITVKQIKESPEFKFYYEELAEFLNPDNIIVGHNIDYDIRMVNLELSKIGEPLVGSRKIDTIRIAKQVFPTWSNYKLDDLCREYGLIIDKRHRALDDAYATAVAFLNMKEKLKEQQNSQNIQGLF